MVIKDQGFQTLYDMVEGYPVTRFVYLPIFHTNIGNTKKNGVV